MSETINLELPPAGRRGGNRLPTTHPHYAWTPRYTRIRELPPDPCRHDRVGAEAIRRCIRNASQDGDLFPMGYLFLNVLLDFGDFTGQNIYPSHKKIGERIGIAERTVRRYLRRLKQAGWLTWKHRYTIKNGMIRGQSNMYQITPPAKYQKQVREQIDGAKRRSPKKGMTRFGILDAPRPKLPAIADVIPTETSDIDTRTVTAEREKWRQMLSGGRAWNTTPTDHGIP